MNAAEPEPIAEGDDAPPQPGDADLVRACARGDARAWETLVRRYQRLIYTIPRRARLDEQDAADVFQTVFQRLYEHLGRIAQPERLQAWLVTTARRETLRRLREGRRAAALPAADDRGEPPPADDPADPDPLPDELLQRLQEHQQLRMALERLGEPCRTLLTLLYGEEDAVPYAQIASRLQMPAGSIGPTRARCLAKLRRLLEAP